MYRLYCNACEVATVLRLSFQVAQSQQNLTDEQMAALEKAVAFVRDALVRTGSAYLRISEMHIAPGKAHGYVEMSIRIDDSSNPA